MQLNETIIIPIIISIVELAKSLGLPKKLSALLAVVLGIAIGIFYLNPLDIKLGIFEGTVLGLSAAGLYSGTKNAFQQIITSRNAKV
ncbi:MAG: hypothetical protein A2Y23_13890 [Clostridiales bacterium GWB2_37_7]|nr:MAG: hypothetical protein A2Y23_13890 [Clostridiales bacterium GWB2_37_7]